MHRTQSPHLVGRTIDALTKYAEYMYTTRFHRLRVCAEVQFVQLIIFSDSISSVFCQRETQIPSGYSAAYVQSLICASTVRYGVPALILEAIRRTDSFFVTNHDVGALAGESYDALVGIRPRRI